MAFEECLQSFTMEAAADLSAQQYRFVKVSADKTVAVAGLGEHTVGVNQGNVDAAGKAVQVGFAGISKVEAGAAITAGALVTPDANGKAAVAGVGNHVAGVALVGGAATELIPVLLYSGAASA